MKKDTYSEIELVGLIKEKNQKAFSYLYDNYSQAMFSVILFLVKDKEEAEDVLQNSFLKIWNNFESYDADKGRLFTWMVNITRNLSIDTLRSKNYKNKNKIQELKENVYTHDYVINEEKMHDGIGLKKTVNFLNSSEKELIELAYYEGYTQKEISEMLNMPLGSVKTKIRHALLNLRVLHKENGYC